MKKHISIDDQIKFIKALLRRTYDEYTKAHLESILKTLNDIPKNVY